MWCFGLERYGEDERIGSQECEERIASEEVRSCGRCLPERECGVRGSGEGGVGIRIAGLHWLRFP